MEAWPLQDENSMNAFYGNPDPQKDGRPDLKWEAANIVRIVPPFPMFLAWNPTTPLKTIAIHKRCSLSLLRALVGLSKAMPPSDLEKHHLNRYGGAYHFRAMRGHDRLSIHSWGAAIDIAPDLNPLGREYASAPRMMPMPAIKAFEAEGWLCGYLWNRADAQHFQAARVS